MLLYQIYDFYIECKTPISLTCGVLFKGMHLKLLRFSGPWCGCFPPVALCTTPTYPSSEITARPDPISESSNVGYT